MLKQIILILVGFVFLFSYKSAFSAPNINEFMYDLDGADIDWVEIYNEGDAIDLTTLKLTINSGSNHGIVHYSGNQTLNSGDFGVIVATSQIGAFTSKWGTGGNIFTSSFSLPNTEATIEINNGDKNSPISSISYESGDGGAGDGKSIQLISGSWIASSPTIGQANQAGGSSDDDEEENDTNDGEGTTTQSSSGGSKTTNTTKKVSKTLKTKAEILVPAVAYVGIHTPFQGKVIGVDGQPIMRGKYFWNFGDGDSREVKTIGTDKFDHTYFYPGDYIVTLEYFSNSFTDEPEATEEIKIKVVEAGVSISKVGDEKDFFVELTNDSAHDIDISKWKLVSEFKVFNFPRNTNLGSKKKMIVSSKLTNFSVADKNTLKLFDSEGEIVFDYPLSLTTQKTSKTTSAKSINYFSKSKNDFENFDEETTKDEDMGELSANSFMSGVFSEGGYLPIIASIIFIGTSASAVYIIRKRKSDSSNGDDFEILKD